MSFFERLQQETETERQILLSVPQIQDGVAGNISLQMYRDYLTEAYHHVKHTVPLLMLCGARLPQEKEWLREAIAEYIEEETGHQEWILDDINAAGGNAEAVRHGQPKFATELMVSYAYDYIGRINPVGFFGMVLVLEGTSIALATNAAETLQKTLNLPRSAFRYLLSHGSLDVSHMQFYEKLMNRVTDGDDQQAIIHVAKVMYRLYAEVFRSVPYGAEQIDAA